MDKPTLKEKYEYLLSKLEIQDIDLWEQDACLALKKRLYFQFSQTDFESLTNVDKAVEAAMMTEKI